MDAAGAFPAPESLDDGEAAAFFISYQTGWFALHRRAQLTPGETLLVHAAAGGVGGAAVQLGKVAGARVIGVVGGEEKAEAARALGADVGVDRRAQDFVSVVKDMTGGRGADVIYDPVGGDAYDRSAKCVAFEGRILVIGFAGGRVPGAGAQPRPDQELLHRGPALGPVRDQGAQGDPGLPRSAPQAGRRRCHQAAGQ